MYWNPDIPKAWVHFCQRILLESDIHKPWKNSASSNREVGIYLHQSELRFSDIHVKSSKLTVNSCINFHPVIRSSSSHTSRLLDCCVYVALQSHQPWSAAFYKTGLQTSAKQLRWLQLLIHHRNVWYFINSGWKLSAHYWVYTGYGLMNKGARKQEQPKIF